MSDLGETRPGAVTTNGGRRSGDHKSEQLRGAGWCEWSCKTVLDRPRWWRTVCNCSRKVAFRQVTDASSGYQCLCQGRRSCETEMLDSYLSLVIIGMSSIFQLICVDVSVTGILCNCDELRSEYLKQRNNTNGESPLKRYAELTLLVNAGSGKAWIILLWLL